MEVRKCNGKKQKTPRQYVQKLAAGVAGQVNISSETAPLLPSEEGKGAG